jgi:hypothetical protein
MARTSEITEKERNLERVATLNRRGVIAETVELPYWNVPPFQSTSEEPAPIQGEEEAEMEERAYQVRAPVQWDGVGRRLTDQIVSSEVTLELRDLASVSPGVQGTIRRDLTKSRRPVKANHLKQVMFKVEQDILPSLNDEAELKLEYDTLNLSKLPVVLSVFVTDSAS